MERVVFGLGKALTMKILSPVIKPTQAVHPETSSSYLGSILGTASKCQRPGEGECAQERGPDIHTI